MGWRIGRRASAALGRGSAPACRPTPTMGTSRSGKDGDISIWRTHAGAGGGAERSHAGRIQRAAGGTQRRAAGQPADPVPDPAAARGYGAKKDAARQRARSRRHPSGAGGLLRTDAAARRQELGLPRRERHYHGDDPSQRPRAAGREGTRLSPGRLATADRPGGALRRGHDRGHEHPGSHHHAGSSGFLRSRADPRTAPPSSQCHRADGQFVRTQAEGGRDRSHQSRVQAPLSAWVTRPTSRLSNPAGPSLERIPVGRCAAGDHLSGMAKRTLRKTTKRRVRDDGWRLPDGAMGQDRAAAAGSNTLSQVHARIAINKETLPLKSQNF